MFNFFKKQQESVSKEDTKEDTKEVDLEESILTSSVKEQFWLDASDTLADKMHKSYISKQVYNLSSLSRELLKPHLLEIPKGLPMIDSNPTVTLTEDTDRSLKIRFDTLVDASEVEELILIKSKEVFNERALECLTRKLNEISEKSSKYKKLHKIYEDHKHDTFPEGSSGRSIICDYQDLGGSTVMSTEYDHKNSEGKLLNPEVRKLRPPKVSLIHFCSAMADRAISDYRSKIVSPKEEVEE